MDKKAKALKRILSEFPWLWALSNVWSAKHDSVTVYRGGNPGEEKFRRFIFEMFFFCQEEHKNLVSEFKIFIKYDGCSESFVMITPTQGMPLFLGYYDSFFARASVPGAHCVCITYKDGNERKYMLFLLPENWRGIAKAACEVCC
ncbi:MAG: hypothetical protein PHC97_01460 [Patescibacteria group bacterium]|nr:hypothetical protein [Patescibacteria group bacterium]